MNENNDRMLIDMRNLISKALSFYCGKYKRRFNYSEIDVWNDYEHAGTVFEYDNRKYNIQLTLASEKKVSSQ